MVLLHGFHQEDAEDAGKGDLNLALKRKQEIT